VASAAGFAVNPLRQLMPSSSLYHLVILWKQLTAWQRVATDVAHSRRAAEGAGVWRGVVLLFLRFQYKDQP
jgi:hypothetical protein